MKHFEKRLGPALAAVFFVFFASLAFADAEFRRGDTNDDGEVNIADPLAVLGYLFVGEPSELACLDAADANDDGSINIVDATATLNFLFGDGFEPPTPGVTHCGPDPSDDELSCANSAACGTDPIVQAVVLEVTTTGSPGEYRFSVRLESPDTGCDQYADWWEVVTPEGELLYRRILTHSHVTEQPFTRSGGPVAIDETTEVIVRGHMNTSDYGTSAFGGSVATGFAPVAIDRAFAADLAEAEPLPDGCAF